MRDAKDVRVERAIVHIIDHLKKKDVVASEIELVLDGAGAQPLRDYFTAQVNNALNDAQTGSAKFADAGDQTTRDEIISILDDQKQFVRSSQKLARSLLAAMGNDGRITPGNIVVCIFTASNYANKQFLALFKIDPTEALIEKVGMQNGKQAVTFEVRSDVMPTAREKLHKAAIIPPAGMDKKFDLLLLDRQVAAVAANFFALTFLNTVPVLDPVASTKSFLFGAEKARLEKEMARVKSDIARIDAKLGNADFVARAPEDVVEGEREKREEAETRRLKIDEALARLKGAA